MARIEKLTSSNLAIFLLRWVYFYLITLAVCAIHFAKFRAFNCLENNCCKKVKFCCVSVRMCGVQVYSTYSIDEYDRRNEDVNPLAASAEYELEKRIEKMDQFDIEVEKGQLHNAIWWKQSAAYSC